MKLSLNWLNEFVDLSGIEIKDLISRFALTTAEIDGYEIKAVAKEIIVAEIKTAERIEGSKKLSKLTVWDGKKIIPVVCGAPNARAGILVAFAPAGTRVGDIVLEKVKIGGVDSYGMCLSEHEMGISENHDGILEVRDFAPNATAGTPIVDAFPFVNDTIIDVDNKSITNRPDLWGHVGMAREFAVMFNRKTKKPELADLKEFDTLPKYPVAIETDGTLSYGAIKVENVTRKKSTLEMAVRLYYCGINSHGFLVDLSNYIMLEMGQPNHAFDGAKVGKISAGSVAGGNFTTLKDNVIRITKDMTFIKSNGEPVALAGIMGGKNSEIGADTTATVLEFATFDGAAIRKTAAAVGLRTDSSARFEKSLDTNLNITAAARTIYLLQSADKGAKVVSAFTRVTKAETKQIPLTIDMAYVERFCGIKFDFKTVVKNLETLGFEPKISGATLAVTVPTWRASKDVTCPADIIEEIVRTYGYDKIAPIAPRVCVAPVAQPARKVLVDRVKNALAFNYHCNEVHTYIWSTEPTDLRVVNSCVKGCDFIRESLMPSLVAVVQKNRATVSDIRVFEVGRAVVKKAEQCLLGICVPSYRELGQIIRELFDARFEIGKGAPLSIIHPKNNAAIMVDGVNVGTIGVVIDKDEYAVAEINLDTLLKTKNCAPAVTFANASKYPKTQLDFTFEWANNKSGKYIDIENAFNKLSHKFLMGYRLKDIYMDKYTLQFTVGSFEKTLTSDEINDVWAKIISHAKNNNLTLKQ
jgi:phenylalanyl-tRNA synthetase beta chain